MSVTTLFRMKPEPKCPSDENVCLFLDCPDHDPQKQAFLNHCSVCEPCLRRWNDILQVVEAGAQLPLWQPQPGMAARILDQAYAEIFPTQTVLTLPAPQHVSFFNLPGWRAAWVALILVFSLGIYLQFESPQSAYAPSQKIDEKISSLEQNLEKLQADLEYEIAYYTEDSI